MFRKSLWEKNYFLIILLIFVLQQKCILAAEDFSTEEDEPDSDEIAFDDEDEHITTTTPEVVTEKSRADFFLEDDNYDDDVSTKSKSSKTSKYSSNDSPVYPDPLSDFDTKPKRQESENKIKKSLQSLQDFEVTHDDSKDIDNSPVASFGSEDDEQGQRFKDWITHQKKIAYSAYEKHRNHHEAYRRYGHRDHKSPKSFTKYKKYQPPYYTGQLNYYGMNSYNVPSKVRSHHYHENHEPNVHHHKSHHHHHHHHRSHHRYIHDTDNYNRDNKWPHLSRVHYQLYETSDRDEDLPPYIRKYNRRNKQLLDLLEGTMPPPTPPQQKLPEIVSTNKRRQRKHHRYHNRRNPKRIMEDLFEEQRANPNNPNRNDEDQYQNDSASLSPSPTIVASMSYNISSSSSLSSSSSSSSSLPAEESKKDSDSEELKLIQKNELPGDQVDISGEEDTSQGHQPLQSESSSSSIVSNNLHSVSSVVTPHDELRVSPKANKFIYHRVPSPRVVGIGGTVGINGSKKQRLPFVAITDRRLEPSKTRQKDVEQNHLPLP